MTLAVILFFSIFWAGSNPVWSATITHQSGQPAAASPPAKAAQSQASNSEAQTQNPSTSSQPSSSTTAPAQTASHQKPSAATPSRKKKKVAASDCDKAPVESGTAAASSSPSNAPSVNAASGGNPPTPSSGVSPGPKNCPPSKIIVRHGSTSEPSIQLAGPDEGNQATLQRDSANQMIESAETNLKKIAGRQLEPSQQDMVNQIRQFVDQSKTAVAAGDFDRAHTLAWKAQVLSEELVKTQQ